MKTKLFALLLILPMMTFCTPDPIDPGQEGPEQPADTTQQQPADTTQQEEPNPLPPSSDTITPEEVTTDLAPEITDGALVLASNENVEKFLTEVKYPDHDYSYSKILEYKGGYDGSGSDEVVKSDKPAVYTIRWTPDVAAGALKLELSEPTWSRTKDITAGQSYVEITNLVPDTHYSYKVTAANGTVMTEGEFDTYGSVHLVYFKHSVRNARDLGGWLTYDNKMVKYRKIYRGGRLGKSYINSSGKKDILAEGIRAQLDIRGSSDVNKEATLPEFDFCAPIISTGGDDMLKADGGEKMRMCMQFIIDCIKADKPVYFHCSLGRDRTGTLGLVILGLLDVIEGDISKEYEITYFSPVGWSIAEDGKENKRLPLTFRNLRTKWAYQPAAEYLWKYVQEGERFSKGVERYLLEIGISQEDIDTFRELMLTEPYPEKTPVAAE